MKYTIEFICQNDGLKYLKNMDYLMYPLLMAFNFGMVGYLDIGLLSHAPLWISIPTSAMYLQFVALNDAPIKPDNWLTLSIYVGGAFISMLWLGYVYFLTYFNEQDKLCKTMSRIMNVTFITSIAFSIPNLFVYHSLNILPNMLMLMYIPLICTIFSEVASR